MSHFGGLLNSAEDLLLVSLSLASRTHEALVRDSIKAAGNPLSRPLPCPAFAPAHPVAPSPHTQRAHSDIGAGNLHLHVPRLRVPWWRALADALKRRLGLCLLPAPSRPGFESARAMLAVLGARDVESREWRELVATFYVPPSPSDAEYNSIVMEHVCRTAGPGALEGVAVRVKLNFAHNLVSALRNEVSRACDRSAALGKEDGRQLPNSRARRPGERDYFSGGREWNGGVNMSDTRGSSKGGFAGKISLAVEAHWIMDGFSSSPGCLLQGGLIPGPAVPAVIDMLSVRYGIHVQLQGQLPEPDPSCTGSLASLSNNGTALFRPEYALGSRVHGTYGRKWALRGLLPPHRVMHPPYGRGPVSLNESLDAYLAERFNVRWPRLCPILVRKAMIRLDAEESVRLDKFIMKQQEIIDAVEDLKSSLIRRAVACETAGASLATICAFAIAQHDPCEVVEQQLESYPSEYREILQYARRQIKELDSGCAIVFEKSEKDKVTLPLGAG